MFEFIHLKETDSTNTYLRKMLDSDQKVNEFTVVYTDFQSAGRGQTGNHWESQENRNLLFSLLLCPENVPVNMQFCISQAASLGILDVLNAITPGFTVKWPNDIYHGEKKIAGMLIENDIAGSSLFHSVIGIGLNVNQEKFLSNAPNPVSLMQITGREFNTEQLLQLIVERITLYYRMAQKGEFEELQQLYMQYLFRKDGYHTFRNSQGDFTAKIHDIDLTGILTLENESGNCQSYAFKEVQFII